MLIAGYFGGCTDIQQNGGAGISAPNGQKHREKNGVTVAAQGVAFIVSVSREHAKRAPVFSRVCGLKMSAPSVHVYRLLNGSTRDFLPAGGKYITAELMHKIGKYPYTFIL